MRPLRVALVVKPSPSTRERSLRNMGMWSYETPYFTWEHFSFSDGQTVDTRRFADYDLIFHEDSCWCTYSKPHRVPVVYYAIDSTLSKAHYDVRRKQAERADLVLVDHDRLTRFPKARRLPYCVNDQIFNPLDKTLDVSFHCGAGASRGMPGGVERNELRAALHDICERRGWSYRSGGLGLLEYADSMGRSKIVANWPRTPLNRPHRVFDAMAAGACLVTGRLPDVNGDLRQAGVHFIDFTDKADLPVILHYLLDSGQWQEVAAAGHELVMERHTWSVRARELREMLGKELGL